MLFFCSIYHDTRNTKTFLLSLKSSFCDTQILNSNFFFRLITGNYKSNGNLVSLKVDIIDFTDFQRAGCLVTNGSATDSAHSHAITGTLFCQPDSNTVRLNITVVGPCQEKTCSWDSSPLDPSLTVPTLKDVKPWVMTTNKMAGGCTDTTPAPPPSHKSNMQYLPFTSPVSPPSHEAPPPLLDFHSDQLISEIHSMSFDYGCGISLNSQLLHDSPVSLGSSVVGDTVVDTLKVEPQQQQQLSQQLNILVKPYSVSLVDTNPGINQSQPTKSNTTATGELPLLSSSTSLAPSVLMQTGLLQPKLERSDSICSEYSTGHDPLGNLDDIETENSSYSTNSPQNTPSPLLFNTLPLGSQVSGGQLSKEKHLFSTNVKSFKSEPEVVTSSWHVVTSTSSSPINTFGPALSRSTTLNCPVPVVSRSPGHGGGPLSRSPSGPLSRSPSGNRHVSGSPGSSSGSGGCSDGSSPPQFILNTPPKQRNRRNSSFDETKPHVCGQCGARFTTKSNLGQHAKETNLAYYVAYTLSTGYGISVGSVLLVVKIWIWPKPKIL